MSQANNDYGTGGDQNSQGGYGQSGQSDYGQPGGYGQQPSYGQQGSYGEPGGYGQPSADPYSQSSAPDAYTQPSAQDPYSQASAQDSSAGYAPQDSYGGYAQQPTQDPYGGYQQPGYDQGQAGYPVEPGYGQPYAGAYGVGYDAAHPPRPSVGFGQAIKLFFKNYANFYGRASRSEFWWAYLGVIIAILVPYFIGVGATAAAAANNQTSVIGSLFLGIMLIVSLAVFIPQLAISVRRLHDSGRSGWLYLVSLIPLVGGIILLILLVGESKPEGVRFDHPSGSQPRTQ